MGGSHEKCLIISQLKMTKETKKYGAMKRQQKKGPIWRDLTGAEKKELVCVSDRRTEGKRGAREKNLHRIDEYI